jgi:hypothetical protein
VRAKSSRGLLLTSIALVALGVILLLNNYLLLSGFNVSALWPLLLVFLGAVILLRGDVIPRDDARTFGITRGSVEAATLEISAGEVDVTARPLQREGRLIAGQYAAESRPALNVHETTAHLRMERASTPWLSFSDWEVSLAHDLPWQLYVSTSLGQVKFDLTGLIVQRAVIATGFGDIRVVCPREALEPLELRSNLGNIHFLTPPGSSTRVYTHGSRFFKVHADPNRYDQSAPGVYTARNTSESALIEVHIYGTFGDAYLA